MKTMIKGIDVKLYINDIPETIGNVLVGEPSSAGFADNVESVGSQLAYALAVPKGDTHDWQDKKVEFFGQIFRTVGYPIQGIDENIPLDWNKKIRAELLRTNGSCTVFQKDNYSRHLFKDVFISDERSMRLVKMREQTAGELTVLIYSVNCCDGCRIPQIGDIVVQGSVPFEFDTSSEKSVSESMAQFRKQYPDHAVITDVKKRISGTKTDFIVTAK